MLEKYGLPGELTPHKYAVVNHNAIYSQQNQKDDVKFIARRKGENDCSNEVTNKRN